METKRSTTEFEKEVFEFLHLLQNTGKTNMLGSAPFVMSEFDVDGKTARRIVSLWIKNYNHDRQYDLIEDVKNEPINLDK